MIRILAVIGVLLGSFGYGMELRREYQDQSQILSDLRDALCFLKQEITYSHIPLHEACGRVSEHIEAPFRELFQKVEMKMNEHNGIEVQAIWREEVSEMVQTGKIKGEARHILEEMDSMWNYFDLEMQVQKIAMMEEKVQEKYKKRKEKEEGLCKLYVTMGLLGGMLVTIFFL